MKALLDALSRAVRDDADHGLARRMTPARGIDFVTNDYLGLGASAELRRRVAVRLAGAGPLGAPASRLLGGTHDAHLHLEARLARWKGAEAALLFASGYQANLALLGTLIAPSDRVISDALNHASLIDGLRLSRPGTKVIFPHLDRRAVAAALAEPHPKGRTFLLTEAVFSMDGDLAPLLDYAELTERYGAALIVDEAHASGLYGPRGSGWVEALGLADTVLATVTTFGKSLGLGGACIAGPAALIDFLVHRARPLIFSTAIPVMTSLAIEAALELLAEHPKMGQRALTLADRLRDRLRIPAVGSAIVPLFLGDEARVMAAARALAERGFAVGAVRPPTVPRGTARLRISVHADRTEEEVDALAAALELELKR